MGITQEEILSSNQTRQPRRESAHLRVLGLAQKEALCSRFGKKGGPLSSAKEEPTTPGSVQERSLPHQDWTKKEAQYEALQHLPTASSMEGRYPQETGLLSLRRLLTRQESSRRRCPPLFEDVLLKKGIRCDLIHQNPAFLLEYTTLSRVPAKRGSSL
ncbi:UNVERIFIED_CONTAM: hypothetical protein Sindi_1488800 [Sesamum indicum]